MVNRRRGGKRGRKGLGEAHLPHSVIYDIFFDIFIKLRSRLEKSRSVMLSNLL